MSPLLLVLACSTVNPLPPPPPPITWVPLTVPCDTGQCEVEGAQRPDDATVSVDGPVDLLGPSFEYRHQDSSGRIAAAAVDPTWPALLVRVYHRQEGSHSDVLHVVSLQDGARTDVLTLPISRSNPDGSGMSSTGTTQFERVGDGPLEIRIRQTGIGPRDQEPYMPGAPVEDSYTWSGTKYTLAAP